MLLLLPYLLDGAPHRMVVVVVRIHASERMDFQSKSDTTTLFAIQTIVVGSYETFRSFHRLGSVTIIKQKATIPITLADPTREGGGFSG